MATLLKNHRSKFMRFIKKHFEWTIFLTGLILLAFMNPEVQSSSFCLFDMAGITFCPGEGLGHSIAFTFRGDFESALNAHFAGPLAVLILSLRIINRWQQLIFNHNTNIRKDTNG